MSTSPKPLYIEANALCAPHQSGIGHAVTGLVRALVRDRSATARYRLILITPLGAAAALAGRGLEGVDRRTMPLPLRGYDRWAGLPWLPPLDLFLGPGQYVFPNFGNWPLIRSRSTTFVHDLAFIRHADTVEARTRARLQANARRWVMRSSLVVTPSAFSLQEVKECLHVPESRLAVVPWGVDRSLFFPRTPSEVDCFRAKYQLPADYILFLGNIEPRKNLVRLVTAYRRLPPSLKSSHPLLLVGSSSWHADEIESEIDESRRRGDAIIRLRSRISDEELPALLSGAAVVAHPALYEGFGLVPLQAMACGVPVLVANRSAMPEVVGGAGVCVDPVDEDRIAAGLTSLLQRADLRADLVRRGLARARDFSWEHTVSALLRALERVDQN